MSSQASPTSGIPSITIRGGGCCGWALPSLSRPSSRTSFLAWIIRHLTTDCRGLARFAGSRLNLSVGLSTKGDADGQQQAIRLQGRGRWLFCRRHDLRNCHDRLLTCLHDVVGLVTVESERIVTLFIWLASIGFGGYWAAPRSQSKGWPNSLVVGLLAEWIVGADYSRGKHWSRSWMDCDELHFGLALGLGLATLMFGDGLVRIIRGLMPKAKCPQCERVWEIPGDEPVWLTWNCCPGCGLKMIAEC